MWWAFFFEPYIWCLIAFIALGFLILWRKK